MPLFSEQDNPASFSPYILTRSVEVTFFFFFFFLLLYLIFIRLFKIILNDILALHFKERKVVFSSGYVEKRNTCLDIWQQFSFQQLVLLCQYY